MTAEEFNDKIFGEEIKSQFRLSQSGISTLLIPEFMQEHFKMQEKKFGGKAEYLTHLLKRFRTILKGYAKDAEGLKTLYQKKNQGLKKVNFRPADEDWAELGIFSIATGRSRCLLFAILLLFDMGGFDSAFKQAGIPMNAPFTARKKWELISSLGVDRENLQFFRGFSPKLIL